MGGWEGSESLLELTGGGLGPSASLTSVPSPLGQIITDVIGNPEEERRAEFYQQPWAQEAVGRHIFAKVSSGWDGVGMAVTEPWEPGQRPSLTAAVPPGAAAPAGTGTSARDPPHLRRAGRRRSRRAARAAQYRLEATALAQTRCAWRDRSSPGLPGILGPSTAESPLPQAPAAPPPLCIAPSPRSPAGSPLPSRSKIPPGAGERCPCLWGAAASPTPSPAGPPCPSSTKVHHSKRQLPPMFCTIFVNRFYIKKKTKKTRKNKKPAFCTVGLYLIN